MKRLLLIFCLSLAPYTYAQNIIDQAAKEPGRNQNGDPTNNIIDPDGSKQGDWLYIDSHGKDVIKQTYKNNELQKTFINIGNQWINVDQLQTDESIKGKLSDDLKAKGIEILSDQQVLIIKDGNDIHVYGLGQWSNEVLQKCIQELLDSLDQYASKITKPTYIIL